uniref:Uncharacterized protein n=1 Tax=Opuntia streptacantha TaxID=393608 RepID=A0A7C9AJQ6_OPUST
MQKDIFRFHITMDDFMFTPTVQISKATGCSKGNIKSLLPFQDRAIAEESTIQGSTTHVLINQQALTPLSTKSFQPHQIHMMNVTNNRNLCAELLHSLNTKIRYFLHSNYSFVR